MVGKVKNNYRFDLKRMMADCEANYARICQLLPAAALRPIEPASQRVVDERYTIAIAVAEQAEPAKLAIHIRERCPYTTILDIRVAMVGLTMTEGDITTDASAINMAIRLYHDVKMAEVIACNRQPIRLASYEYPNDTMFQPDEKAQQNRLLGEWLSLGLHHGLAIDDFASDVKTIA